VEAFPQTAVRSLAGLRHGTRGLEKHHGVTYGPDGSGGFILEQDASDGTGRFPLAHGIHADHGYYSSQLVPYERRRA
jgi:hypothetical protein